MGKHRRSTLAGISLALIGLFTLFLGHPAYTPRPSPSAANTPNRGAPPLPHIAILSNGKASLECINTGSNNEEVSVMLHQRATIIEEQVQFVSPAFMAVLSFQPQNSTSDNFVLRIARPDGSPAANESALACWLLLYDAADGRLLSTAPLAATADVCLPSDSTQNINAAAAPDSQPQTSVLAKLIPFNFNPFSMQPDAFTNTLVIQPQVPGISVRFHVYAESGEEILTRDLSFTSADEQRIVLQELLGSSSPSKGYIKLIATEGNIEQLTVFMERASTSDPLRSVLLPAKEIEITCTPQCDGRTCGDDGCGGSCGECGTDEQCNADGQCESICTPQCDGRHCGDDGCGGSCGDCPDGEQCNSEGHCESIPCEPDPSSCNGLCGQQTDNCGNPIDCGECPCEPDPNSCNGLCGQQTDNCGNPIDCGECPCEPDPNSCNGLCGSQTDNCGNPIDCGECPCEPDPNSCTGLCGSQTDNCGNTIYCGDCPCEPNCDNKCWGADDGCGGNCWSSWCNWDQVCIDGLTCCTPDCYNRNCGGDGCDGSCGECGSDEQCNADGHCEAPPCEPDPNFCSGLCGSQTDNCGNPVDCGECTAACGDSMIDSGESCDDGNTENGDGCSGSCAVEYNYTCAGEPTICNSNWPPCEITPPTTCAKEGGADAYSFDNGKCYLHYSCPRSYHLAESACQALGGHLATITSDQEAGAVARLKLFGWLGANDRRNEGEFDWVTGEAFSYTDWCDSQPDNSTWYNEDGEDGVENQFCSGPWNDLPAENPDAVITGFICELENLSCPPECSGKSCGDDNCGGSCGECPEGEQCNADGQCESICTPQCDGRNCGDDGCGGSCGDCPEGEQCNSEGHCESIPCEPDPNSCNGLCGQQTDNCGNPIDCGECPCEPDPNSCNGLCGQQTDNCGNPIDCGECPCEPDPNSCNGLCGQQTDNCGNPIDCGECPCEPDPNSCNGLCGSQTDNCGNPIYCGDCPCEPNCDNKCWGADDGCGGNCWSSWCAWDQVCIDGLTCCTPDCYNRNCGGDGCGGSCGDCPEGEQCSAEGRCEAPPCEPDPYSCSGLCGSQMDNCGNWIDCGDCPCEPDPNFCSGLCGSQTDNCGYAVDCGECTAACGDGRIDSGESCDDGNTENGDGCSGSCAVEYNYTCAGEPSICNSNWPPCEITPPTTCAKEGGADAYSYDNGKCYLHYSCPRSYHLAESACQALGGHLATITSDQEAGAVARLKLFGWLGANDRRSEGEFDWVTGEAFSYTDWCDNQPDNSTWYNEDGEDGVENQFCSGPWNDLPAENPDAVITGFICELENLSCPPECSGKSCGDDNCGGSCGECPEGEQCNGENQCEPVCTPQCDGKACGDNGCSGSCGDCPEGEQCNGEGQCEATPCEPNCEGRTCGDNGCAGSCGDCQEGEQCNADGRCEPACTPQCENKTCGDDGCSGSCGECPEGEQCSSEGQCEAKPCEPDCGGRACGGDDGCGASCGDCPEGEQCNADGQCETVCTPQCDGKSCGDNGCSGSCGDCQEGEQCNAESQCEPTCTPQCEGKECGDNGCSGSCGGCSEDEECTADGQCEPTCTPDCGESVCGDDGCGGSCGECSTNETCSDGQCQCQPDCEAKECGDDSCGGSCGECEGNTSCENGLCACQAECGDKDCGDDGCGGSCGSCGENATCEEGRCICHPACDGKECGDNGCDGSCGECEHGECQDGQCVCEPTCSEAVCGEDGCGGSCGDCPSGQMCEAGQCVCEPQCEGKECGDDGCGENCADCPGDGWCVDGHCVCSPQCAGKECGDDDCGGSCGECDAFDTCEDGVCTPCQPDCEGKTCGDNNCGGSCGSCPDDQECNGTTCEPKPCQANCGERRCGGDDGCGNSCGDCPEGEHCTDEGQCEPDPCAPECGDKVCGDNGCGGSCGECEEDEQCSDQGQCEPKPCEPDCGERKCGGDNGCGESCGECPEDEQCNDEGQCEPKPCTPDCEDKECGDDGCDGSCGECGVNEECNSEFQCEYTCGPECADKVCGDDGCGGSCGECKEGEECNSDGRCVPPCEPDCDGKECGDDGCGGSCGECEEDRTCGSDGQCSYCGDGSCNDLEDCGNCEDDCGKCGGELVIELSGNVEDCGGTQYTFPATEQVSPSPSDVTVTASIEGGNQIPSGCEVSCTGPDGTHTGQGSVTFSFTPSGRGSYSFSASANSACKLDQSTASKSLSPCSYESNLAGIEDYNEPANGLELGMLSCFCPNGSIGEATVTAHDAPWQNAANDLSDFGVRYEDGLIKADMTPMPFWFAGSPGRMCWDQTGRYDVSYDLSFSNVMLYITSTVPILLPFADSSATPDETHNISMQQSGNCYNAQSQKFFARTCTTVVNRVGQYRPLTENEENFHCKQWYGQVALGQGGMTDGLRDDCVQKAVQKAWQQASPSLRERWVSPFTICTKEPSDNLENLKSQLYNIVTNAANQEANRTWKLWADRSCFLEYAAKKDLFKEGMTYECTYMKSSGCPVNPAAPSWSECN